MEREIQIEISKQCPLNCVHCSSLELRLEESMQKFDDQMLLSFFEMLSESVHVYYTGGEPLLYNGLEDLCKQTKKIRATNVGLYTCGVKRDNKKLIPLSYEDAERLAIAGVSDCYISIYSNDPKKHNFITNANTLDITCESVNHLIEAGIVVKAHIVLVNESINSLYDTIEFVKKKGFSAARILGLSKIGNAHKHWQKIGIDYNRQKTLIRDFISNYPKNKFEVSVSGFPELFPCRPSADAKGCQRGSKVLYITYTGEVYPCACTKNMSNYKIGSLNNLTQLIKHLKDYDNTIFDCCARMNN